MVLRVGTEFLIAFNRIGMQHMIGEMVYGVICIQGMLSELFLPSGSRGKGELHRLVYMLQALGRCAELFTTHISLTFPCMLYHVLLEERRIP